MKTYLTKLIALALVLVLVMSGCGDKTTGDGTTGAEGTTEAAKLEPLEPLIEIENISDYVTLGQYRGVEAEKGTVEVTEKELQEAIDEIRSYYSTSKQVKEGVIAEGDTAGIDYMGKLDGVAFEGGTGSYDLKIGSNSFIDGFEDGLIGVKVGETVDLNLTFPEDYKSKDLAGKAVVFTVTVKYKVIKVLPEFDDELAQKMEYDSAEEMKEELIKSLEEQEKQDIENNFMVAVWDVIIANSQIKKHDGLYKEYHSGFTGQYESMAAAYGMTLETFIPGYYGIKYEEFVKIADEYATSCMNQELICRAIAVEEKMTVTDEDYAKKLSEYYEQYKKYFDSATDLEAYYGKARLINDVLMERAIDLVIDNAVPVAPSEEPTTGEVPEESTEAK